VKYAKFVKAISKYGVVDKSWIQNNGHELPVKNHTVPVAIRELIPIYRPCQFNCGREVANQHTEYRRVDNKQVRWLEKCVSCGLYKHPQTGEMMDHRSLNKFFPPRNKTFIEDEDK
jgi:cob(I)alamin adenosyltransferase